MSLPADPARLAGAAGAVLAWLAVCGHAAWRVRRERRRSLAQGPDDAGQLLVVHASQTGTAEHLAQETARVLRAAGVAAHVEALGRLDTATLARHRRALFVAATCGEGDPPDTAVPFVRRCMDDEAADAGALAGLEVGLLALGDRSFADFCGFGRRLDDWLHAQGARPLFERVEADALDATALARWQDALGAVSGRGGGVAQEVAAPVQAPLARWRLVARRTLNAGGQGGPVCLVEFAPVDGGARPAWEAGDLVELVVPGADRPRRYSIASVPADGRLQLVVRRVTTATGRPGLASGWLTSEAAIGSDLPLRLVPHPAFRIGANEGRPLILVGNGTGIAGLRAHLRARALVSGTSAGPARTAGWEREPHPRGGRGRQSGLARHWLVFGEREAAHDFHFAAEVQAWQARGVLERVDLAFSRDQAEKVYVQDRLLAAADAVRAWIADDAALYVCGSLAGMAAGVDAALETILGRPALDALIASGRYRRDVY